MRLYSIQRLQKILSVICFSGLASIPLQVVAQPSSSFPDRQQPSVLGYGIEKFRIAKQIAHDDFESIDNWVVQIQKKSGTTKQHVKVENNTLDCLLPGKGCTIWFKQKLNTRVTITYDVLCPAADPGIQGAEPRDINNFWMASDPSGPDKGLFDSSRFTGSFKTYHHMHGYYASTGGAANKTTRMRRYPRTENGIDVSHIALKDRDNQPEFLITPNKKITVQLVAYDDVIQYIADGQLVYQIRSGDEVELEERDSKGKIISTKAINDPKRFPIYTGAFSDFEWSTPITSIPTSKSTHWSRLSPNRRQIKHSARVPDCG